MESATMLNLDGAALSRHIQDDELLLVDFWAAWCAPCRAMAPLLERLDGEFPTLQIVKIDAEEHKHLLETYDVRSLPTLVLYRSGKRVDQLTGKVPYEMMRRAIQSAL